MASNQEGSSNIGRRKGKQTDVKPRRSWSTNEEETLLAALKELVAQGYKSDNGFKNGYLGKLEVALRKVDPTTDLRGNPHINSKIQAWKKYYNSLVTLLSRSGVGFNLEGTFTVDCDKEVWDDFGKTDNNASTLSKRDWPMFEQWKEIFGKDRATGETAEDIDDVVYETSNNECPNNGSEFIVDGDYHVNLDHILSTDKGENSQTGQSTKNHSTQKGKKRKSEEGIQGVRDLLGEISQNVSSRLDVLAARIGYDYDLGKAKGSIYSLVRNISGLSSKDKFNVTEILAKNVEKLEIFMGLPEDDREEYVNHILNST